MISQLVKGQAEMKTDLASLKKDNGDLKAHLDNIISPIDEKLGILEERQNAFDTILLELQDKVSKLEDVPATVAMDDSGPRSACAEDGCPGDCSRELPSDQLRILSDRLELLEIDMKRASPWSASPTEIPAPSSSPTAAPHPTRFSGSLSSSGMSPVVIIGGWKDRPSDDGSQPVEQRLLTKLAVARLLDRIFTHLRFHANFSNKFVLKVPGGAHSMAILEFKEVEDSTLLLRNFSDLRESGHEFARWVDPRDPQHTEPLWMSRDAPLHERAIGKIFHEAYPQIVEAVSAKAVANGESVESAKVRVNNKQRRMVVHGTTDTWILFKISSTNSVVPHTSNLQLWGIDGDVLGSMVSALNQEAMKHPTPTSGLASSSRG